MVPNEKLTSALKKLGVTEKFPKYCDASSRLVK
jgi:hypothetical protein